MDDNQKDEPGGTPWEQWLFKVATFFEPNKILELVARFPATSTVGIQAIFHLPYWLTAGISPLIFIIVSLAGYVFLFWASGNSPLEPFLRNIRTAHESGAGFRIVLASIPFLIAQTAATFACLFMLTTVSYAGGGELVGAWEYFYFSVVTLTTLGYGNIVPASTGAEFLAAVESVFGFIAYGIYAGVIGAVVLRHALSPPENEFEQNMFGVEKPADPEQDIVNARAFGNRYFTQYVYPQIFGSQLALLRALQAGGTVHEGVIVTDYYSAIFLSSHPLQNKQVDFRAWLGFLQTHGLISMNQETNHASLGINAPDFLALLDRAIPGFTPAH